MNGKRYTFVSQVHLRHLRGIAVLHLQRVLVVIAIATLGAYLVNISRAATPSNPASEAEQGTLAGNAIVVPDAEASGSNAVKFNASPVITKTGQVSSYLLNSSSQVMCLDDGNNLSTENNPVVINPCSTSLSDEKWSLYSDNTIRINGKCLSITGNGTADGAAVVIATCVANNKSQQWSTGTDPAVSLNNLVNAGSGKCLNVPNAVTDTATPVQISSCAGNFQQVWGWNTGSTIAQGGDTATANCHSSVLGDTDCYYWVGAYQENNNNLTASGVSATLSQPDPVVPEPLINNRLMDYFLYHSIMEIYVAGPGNQGVEIGWYKDLTDSTPVLFCTDWVNGTFIGYASDTDSDFVQVSSSIAPGDAVTGATGSYKIQFANNQWQIWYNNSEVGYFPESDWTSRGANFTSIAWTSPYGEVVTSSAILAGVQMGNAILGSKAGSAAFSNYALYGSSTPAKLSSFYEPSGIASAYYDYGNTSDTGFTLGGPGP